MESTLETQTQETNNTIFSSILWLLFLSLGLQIVLGILAAIVMAAYGIEQEQFDVILGSPIGLGIFSVISVLIILPMLKGVTKQSNLNDLFHFLGFKNIDKSILIKVVLLGGLYFTVMSLLLYYLNIPTPEFMLDVRDQTNSVIDAFMLVIAIFFIAPIIEEIIFRGVGYGRLKNTRYGVTGAVILTSLLFTFIHLQYDIVNTLSILPLAFLLGYIRYKTDNIWYCIALHFQINVLSSILLFTIG